MSLRVHHSFRDFSYRVHGGNSSVCYRRLETPIIGTTAVQFPLPHFILFLIHFHKGIGGAHRGAQETWDVSADLHELSRTPVIVIRFAIFFSIVLNLKNLIFFMYIYIYIFCCGAPAPRVFWILVLLWKFWSLWVFQ